MDIGDKKDDIYTFPDPLPNIKIVKGETENLEKMRDFVEKKLTKQNEALERIIFKVDKQGVLLERLTDQLSKTLEIPQLPQKIAPIVGEKPQRRSNTNEEKEQAVYEDKEHPIVIFGKTMPLFRRLAEGFFELEMGNETDPTPIIESIPDITKDTEFYRRSAGSDKDLSQKTKWDWCDMAKQCEKPHPPEASICGFDNNYGYGRFIDTCHMFDVNCFFKFNFVLAYTCRPTITVWHYKK